MVIYILCLLIPSYYVVSESIECMVHTHTWPCTRRWGGGQVEDSRKSGTWGNPMSANVCHCQSVTATHRRHSGDPCCCGSCCCWGTPSPASSATPAATTAHRWIPAVRKLSAIWHIIWSRKVFPEDILSPILSRTWHIGGGGDSHSTTPPGFSYQRFH